MFAERFEQGISFISKLYPDEITQARREYATLVGDFFEDDPFYEERIQAFLEWFFFERKLAIGKTPLEEVLQKAQLTEDEKLFFEELSHSIHSIFEVKSIKRRKEIIVLRDLSDLTRYEVKERRKPVGIETGDIIEARIFEHRGNYLFTNSVLKHPKEAAKVIRKTAKRMRKEEKDFQPWIITLTKKRWLLERFPKADPAEVYSEEFQPEWFKQ